MTATDVKRERRDHSIRTWTKQLDATWLCQIPQEQIGKKGKATELVKIQTHTKTKQLKKTKNKVGNQSNLGKAAELDAA